MISSVFSGDIQKYSIKENNFGKKYLAFDFISAQFGQFITNHHNYRHMRGPSTDEHMATWQWRHNGRDSVSNPQPHDCLLNRLFRRRSKKTSKLHVTGLCAGNSPGTGEFPAQMASYAENVSIWWRHHGNMTPGTNTTTIFMRTSKDLRKWYCVILANGDVVRVGCH